MKRLFVLILLGAFVSGSVFAQDKRERQRGERLNKGNAPPEASLINIGGISQWIEWDGLSGHNPLSGYPGGIFPRRTAPAVYQDGLVWGAVVQDTRRPLDPAIRVGGSTYRSGLTPGYIITAGTATSPPVASYPHNARVYRVRPDWESLNIYDHEVLLDAAEFFDIPISSVTNTMSQAILDQYALDWENWPAELGAPYEDVDSNGEYDPQTDIAGIPGAGQTLWLVVNDLDEDATTGMYGSPPIGLEIQITWWGYRDYGGPLGQTIFQRYRIINKSGFQIDSMFVCKWADLDVGNYIDDLAGCDSILNIAYCYNSYLDDDEFSEFGLTPPAIGNILLQGPTVPSPGDTAIVNMQKLPDFKNLPMTSFTYKGTGGSPYSDPIFDEYKGTLMWYNYLNGYIPTDDIINPEPFIHGGGAFYGQPTKFPLNGNPLTSAGDIDGRETNLPPGNRRINNTTGPFYMQPGDTQEVIYALVGGITRNYLTAIEKMKSNAQSAIALQKNLYRNVPSVINLTYETVFVSPAETELHFRAENDEALSILLQLVTADDSPVIQIPLYDDGAHNDSLSGDGIWANSWTGEPFSVGLCANANVEYQEGFAHNWQYLLKNITTSGPVKILSAIIGSDNLNHDGTVNPGENIRYTLDIENSASSGFSNVHVFQFRTLTPEFVSDLVMPNGYHQISLLPPSGSYNWPYSANDTYFQFQLSNQHPGNGDVEFEFYISDGNNNVWKDIVRIPVTPLSSPVEEYLMAHISGNASGQLGLRIFDENLVKNNVYQVNFNDLDASNLPVYELRNLDLGITLASNQPYPDLYGHNSNPFDGFLVTKGSTSPFPRVDDWEWIGERWLTGVNWGGNLLFGGIDIGSNFFGSTLAANEFNSVEIVFDSTLTSECAVYRRDLGYEYAGIGIFPGAAYDISDPSLPRRINICFVEDNNVSAANGSAANLKWDLGINPNTGRAASVGGREYLYFMDSDYDSGSIYNNENKGITADVVWGCWLDLKVGHTFMDSPGRLFLKYITSVDTNDVFQFNPYAYLGFLEGRTRDLSFALSANYPNPFNPRTQIDFRVTYKVDVKLEVFNVLGQRVRTLVNNEMSVGSYSLEWDGRNDNGEQVSSGLYFYRMQAGHFVKTRKMILLK